MRQNAFAAAALLPAQLGELTTLPQTRSWIWGSVPHIPPQIQLEGLRRGMGRAREGKEKDGYINIT